METTLRTNAVHLNQQAQYELRRQIIRLYLEGKSNAAIAKMLDVSERHVRATKQKYKQAGLAGIENKHRGRKFGQYRLLTPEQEEEIQSIIKSKAPGDLGFRECLWNRKNICALIEQKCQTTLCETSVGKYLKRWGFSLQRPVKRERKQDEKKVKEWVEATYPEICAAAKEKNAEIFFLVMKQECKIVPIM